MSAEMMGPPKGKTAGQGAAASKYRAGMVASGDHVGAGKGGGEPEADRVTATQDRAEIAPTRGAVDTESVSHGAAATAGSRPRASRASPPCPRRARRSA